MRIVNKFDRIGNRTFKALEYLYLNSKEMQEEEMVRRDRFRDLLSNAKEFSTVKISSSRRAGHTTAIAKFILKHKNENWAVMSLNQNSLKNLYLKIERMGDGFICKKSSAHFKFNGKNAGTIQFMSIHDFDSQLRGLELDGIIVDCASFMNQSKIELLYRVGIECMRNKPYAFFILVE